jgi:hypothetical protein
MTLIFQNASLTNEEFCSYKIDDPEIQDRFEKLIELERQVRTIEQEHHEELLKLEKQLDETDVELHHAKHALELIDDLIGNTDDLPEDFTKEFNHILKNYKGQ